MKNPLTPEARADLLVKREQLVSQIQALKAKAPGRNDPEYKHRFYREDLEARAKGILTIDRRLGRI